MCKSLLTIFVVLVFADAAFAASTSGRVTMTVIRTDVVPADENIVESSDSDGNTVASSSGTYTVEVIY